MSLQPFPWALVPRSTAADAALVAWAGALGGRWRPGAATPAADAVHVTVRASAGTAVVAVAPAAAIAFADHALDRAPGIAAPRAASPVEAALAAFAVAERLSAAGVAATAEVGGALVGPTARVALPRLGEVVLAATGAPPARAADGLGAALAAGGDRLPPARAALEAGRAMIEVRRLAAVAPRDVVVVGGAAGLAIARGRLPATLDRARGCLTVSGPYERDAVIDPRELLAGDLRVPLTVVIGEVELSARALLELTAGQVLTVPVPVGGPVELRAGGRAVARGELVVVDGEVGVRVTDVLSAPPTA